MKTMNFMYLSSVVDCDLFDFHSSSKLKDPNGPKEISLSLKNQSVSYNAVAAALCSGLLPRYQATNGCKVLTLTQEEPNRIITYA